MVIQILPSYSLKDPVSPVFKSNSQFWIRLTTEIEDVKVSWHEELSKFFVNDGPGYVQTELLDVIESPKRIDFTVLFSIPGTEIITSTRLLVILLTFNSPRACVFTGDGVGNEQLSPTIFFYLF